MRYPKVSDLVKDTSIHLTSNPAPRLGTKTMIHIPLDQTAPAITDSATQVLVAHGYRVVTKTGEQLSPTEGRALMREIGNNAAQVLAGMDENPENQ